jgi:hypothetical protein
LPGNVAPGRLRLDLLVAAWMNFVELRQREMCKTAVIAYVSDEQTAFKMNSALRASLVDNRKDLLTTLDANDVDPDDIVDADFRSALVNYNGPRSGRMPGKPPGTPRPPSPELLDVPVLVGVPMGDGDGGGAGFLLLLAAAAALFG